MAEDRMQRSEGPRQDLQMEIASEEYPKLTNPFYFAKKKGEMKLTCMILKLSEPLPAPRIVHAYPRRES